MRKFKYNLEKILGLRKFKEEECKIALGQAISFLNKIENDIRLTAQKKHTAVTQRFKNTDDIVSWDFYIKRLDAEADMLSEKAAQAQLVVEQKRALYLEAQKELKTLEKLKEKQKKEHRKEMLNYEINQIDELTSARQIYESNF